MKITYLRLKNFASIKTGMDASEIEIDLKDATNTIIILSGKNGKGKTSILSTLHPFAYNGTLDSRSDLPLILQNKDGEKEIHITDGLKNYVIKHYYTHSKKSHTVKSFFAVDGIEMNENGNVTSFKEFVNQYLDLDMDYLRLIRLGSNVTNFIDLKSTERKAYMSKILSEVDYYLKAHKKISADMNNDKALISHLSNMISRLNINDEEVCNKELKIIRKQINEYSDRLIELNQNDAIINHQLSEMNDLASTKEELKSNEKIYNKMISKLDNVDINIDEANVQLNDIDKNIVKTNETISAIENKITLYTNQLDLNITNKKNLNIELDKEINKIDSSSYDNIINELSNKIKENQLKFINYNPELSKEDIEKGIGIILKAQDMLNITYEFGDDVIAKTIKKMKKNENVMEFVNKKREQVASNKLAANTNSILNIMNDKFPIIYPACNNAKCSLLRFWKELQKSLYKDVKVDDSLKDDDFYNYMGIAYNNILKVFNIFIDNKEIMNKMPKRIQEMLVLKNLYNNIGESKMIYDRDIVYQELTKITEYTNYIKDKELLEETKEKLRLVKNSTNKDVILLQISNIDKEILELTNNKNKSLSDLNKFKEKFNNLLNEKSELETIIDYTNNKINIKSKIDNLQSEIESINSLNIKHVQLSLDINNLSNELRKKQEFEKILSRNIEEYKSLNNELNKIKNEYDELGLIKKALSSKEGIPLIYINIYLKNTMKLTNEMLHIYDKNISIEAFNVDEDKFEIPYIKNGSRVKDIYYASQGEQSFLSLALSFALASQSITSYNIGLLDEVDSTLDTDNRSKFIDLLEKYLDIIHAEQLFLISHNNMFDMYPVSVISFDNSIDKNNRYATYIEIKKIR